MAVQFKNGFRIVSGTFGGKIGNKLSDFSSKDEMQREQKHLKAYLQGREYYVHGNVKDDTSGLIKPRYYPVIRNENNE